MKKTQEDSLALLESPFLCVSCRLKGERKVTELIERIRIYLEGRKGASHDDDLCRIYILKIEHLYYKVR